jgi:hypothetical protein
MRHFATEQDAREYAHVVEVADFAAQNPTGGHSWDALMAGAAVPTLRDAARADLGRALKKSGWLARVEGAYLYRATPEVRWRLCWALALLFSRCRRGSADVSHTRRARRALLTRRCALLRGRRGCVRAVAATQEQP